MSSLLKTLAGATVAAFFLTVSPGMEQAQAATQTTAKQAVRWHVFESPNFRVYCCASRYCCASCDEASRLAARCEELRKQLAGVWLGEQAAVRWDKRCDVIVYPTLAGYLQAVGREAAQTAGSALIETDGSAVISRRIDLRGDLGQEMQSALAHELTHVIVADRIDRAVIPAWADEGMAVLADHPEKQAAHLNDLREGLRQRATFRTAELMAMDGYPQPQRIGVFYGQSGSLVSYLVHRGTPEHFIRFLEVALDSGYDAALKRVYNIATVGELERLWLNSLNAGEVNFASYVPGPIWRRVKPAEG